MIWTFLFRSLQDEQRAIVLGFPMAQEFLYSSQNIVHRIRPSDTPFHPIKPELGPLLGAFGLTDAVGDNAEAGMDREVALDHVKIRLRHQADGQIAIVYLA
jgi:hypothetical protein